MAVSRRADDSTFSIPELPFDEDPDENRSSTVMSSIFDPLTSEVETSSTSSASTSKRGLKKSKTSNTAKVVKKSEKAVSKSAKPNGRKRLEKLPGVAEELEETNDSLGISGELSVLSSVSSNPINEQQTGRKVRGKKPPDTESGIEGNGEAEKQDDSNISESKTRPAKEKKPKARSKQKVEFTGSNTASESSSNMSEPKVGRKSKAHAAGVATTDSSVSTPGISARLRSRRAKVSESQKENNPPTKPAGTQVNGRMLRVTKMQKKKQTKTEGQQNQILKAPRKSRSKERRSVFSVSSATTVESNSSGFPCSSSPLDPLISPIPSTESGSNGPLPLHITENHDDTMHGVPSVSSASDANACEPLQTPMQSNRNRSVSARRSLTLQLGGEGDVIPNDNEANAATVSSSLEPAATTNSNGTGSTTTNGIVINFQQGTSSGLVMKLSGDMLKSDGQITILQSAGTSNSHNSTLNKTRSSTKLTFAALSKKGGRHRRLTSWSSSSDDDEDGSDSSESSCGCDCSSCDTTDCSCSTCKSCSSSSCSCCSESESTSSE